MSSRTIISACSSLGVLFVSACVEDELDARSAELAVEPEVAAACADTSTIVSRRSLIETNKTVVQQFSMATVLGAVISNSGSVGTASALHDQMFESYRTKAGGAPGVHHCDDIKVGGVPAINGFALECPRADGNLVGKLNSWTAIALVNRFDLAPTSGADCGEQRIIFANNALVRDFVIFEAKIPNPKPSLGLEACRPIAEFWAGLSTVSSATTRAARLKQAFLTGEPTLTAAGFAPFMKAQHFSAERGQIRTNNFAQPPWTLREHKLALVSGPGGQRVDAVLSPVAHDPHGPHWDETRPGGSTCRQAILDNLASLLGSDVAGLGLTLPKSCWTSESRDDVNQDYPVHLNHSPTFQQQLTAKIQALKPGSTLKPVDVANRARFAASCIGCHQRTNNVGLGGGLVAPSSLGFVHVSETGSESCGDGTTCFPISPALKTTFLPRRLQVLKSFLDSGPCALTDDGDLPLAGDVADAIEEALPRTLGGALVGSH